MLTLHLISHTHWDREWYQTFQQFRLKLVHLVDGLLDILDQDPQYRHFMLDGQTIVLDDYLFMRPERAALLRKYVQNGRILIGPWHILPDEFLVSPEATIRNLLQGERTARDFGPKMKVGYIPDPFGHIGQMPQILRGFGIETSCLMRGLADQPCEFWWQSPDGSRVLMAYLRDGYSNGAGLPTADGIKFTAEVRRLSDSLAPFAAAPHIVLMHGTDHMEPSPDTSMAIAYANSKLDGSQLIHSTLPDYFTAVQASLNGGDLPVVTGELRSSKRTPLLPNVLSARMWIKQYNQACETLLEKWVEPFSTWAEWAAGTLPENDHKPAAFISHPAPILRQVWRLLMENHPHDSICGCSIDQVHDEMRQRFDQVTQIGEEITQQSLTALAETIATNPCQAQANPENLVPIIVFNPTSGPRNDRVSVTIELPSQEGDFDLLDETGSLLPFQTSGLGSKEVINMSMGRDEFKGAFGMVANGKVMGMSIRSVLAHTGPHAGGGEGSQVFVDIVISETKEPDLAAWERGLEQVITMLENQALTTYVVRARSCEATHLAFTAPDVPGHGYRTFWARGKAGQTRAAQRLNPLAGALMPFATRLAKSPAGDWLLARLRPDPSSKPPFRIENETFILEVVQDGTISLHDRRSGVTYPGLNRFVDGGDCGDEYNYAPPVTDQMCSALLKSVRIERGAVSQSLEICLELTVPQSLAHHRQSRTAKTVIMPVTSRLTLTAGIPRVDIQTRVDNHASDHRLRVHFPAPFADAEAGFDGHFEVVRRKVGLPEFDSTWVEHPRPEVPQRAFTVISDDSSGKTSLMVANRGLPEVEVLKQTGGNAEIAVTLLRCVGWLSRDDLSTRKGHAGPGTATPGAQLPGQWSFEYAIILPAGENDIASYQQAYAFEAPLRAVSTSLHGGSLPAMGSFIQVEPPGFVISAVKTSEDERGWLVRGYNVTGQNISVSLKPWKPFQVVEQVNLAEEQQTLLLPDSDGRVTFPVRGHQIVTVLFRE
jgi:mannosylglycerate hydrolase